MNYQNTSLGTSIEMGVCFPFTLRTPTYLIAFQVKIVLGTAGPAISARALLFVFYPV
jgi:hypothetical protein